MRPEAETPEDQMSVLDALSKIEKLHAGHDVSKFDSSEKSVNLFLKKYALQNQAIDSSRTYVVHLNSVVVGYYTLSFGSAKPEECPVNVADGMPRYPMGIMIFARFGVDKEYRGTGLAQSLLKDAFLRTIEAAEIGGLKAILLDAINEKLMAYYKRYGFIECPVGERRMMIAIQDVRAAAQ